MNCRRRSIRRISGKRKHVELSSIHLIAIVTLTPLKGIIDMEVFTITCNLTFYTRGSFPMALSKSGLPRLQKREKQKTLELYNVHTQADFIIEICKMDKDERERVSLWRCELFKTELDLSERQGTRAVQSCHVISSSPPCRSEPHALRHKLCVLFPQPFITRTTHNSSSPHHSIMDWIDIPQAPPAQERHNQCLGLNATTWSVDFHQRRWSTAQPPAPGMAWYARSLTEAISVTMLPHHGMAHQHTGSPQCYMLPRIRIRRIVE